VDRFAVMIAAIENFLMTSSTLGHTDLLTAFGVICVRNFIFNEDSFERTFGNACTAIYAGVRVNIVPGPLFDWFARYDAFYWANIDAPRISETQTSDNVSH
jgi:hypothetical protein